jgi:hypothetical protein
VKASFGFCGYYAVAYPWLEALLSFYKVYWIAEVG